MGRLSDEERLRRVGQRLLRSLELSARELDACVADHKEKTKTDTGEILVEYSEKLPDRKGLVDRAALKQLTGVLKDLQEILYADPSSDCRERALRLEKLAAELAESETSAAVRVTLEGETEAYAR